VAVTEVAKPTGGLTAWFGDGPKGDWVDLGAPKKDGKLQPCGRSSTKDSSRGYPKCVPRSKANQMTKKEKQSAVRRKRAAGNTGGKPTNVKTIIRKATGGSVQSRGCGAIMNSKRKRTRI